MDEAEAEQAWAQLLAKATKDSSSRKAALPDIVTGFKVSPLSLSMCIFSIPSLPFDQYLLPMEHIHTILVLSVSFSAEQWAYIYFSPSWRLIFFFFFCLLELWALFHRAGGSIFRWSMKLRFSSELEALVFKWAEGPWLGSPLLWVAMLDRPQCYFCLLPLFFNDLHPLGWMHG
jgi:hypothetical protein